MAEKEAIALKKEANEKELASRKAHEEMSHLTAAKDRAQLSQASAMSILDVTILAELIRRGDDYTMRVPLLVLVSLALLLQIAVGFLSLMISNIKTRYQSFGFGRAICCIGGRPFGQKELDEEDSLRLEAVTAARTVGCSGVGGGGGNFGLESDEAVSLPSGYEPDDFDGARTPLSSLSYTDEVEQSKDLGLQSDTIKPTRADIYASSPPADKFAHVPAPYDQPTLRMREPRNMKAKTVTRLQAWVDQMIESKEAEIETQINIEFLEGELTKRQEKLQHLQQTVSGLKDKEEELNTEWKMTKEEWQKVITEKLQLVNELQNKESELNQMSAELKDKDNSHRSQVKKELQLLKPKLKLLETEEKHAHEKLRHIEKQRRKAREAKTDVEHVESEIKLIKQEKELKERGAREFRVNEGRFKFYQKMAEEIEKRKTLERVMFWQSIINYILYSVFVMNAFIATMSMISDN